jgi:hypothetical protein
MMSSTGAGKMHVAATKYQLSCVAIFCAIMGAIFSNIVDDLI